MWQAAKHRWLDALLEIRQELAQGAATAQHHCSQIGHVEGRELQMNRVRHEVIKEHA